MKIAKVKRSTLSEANRRRVPDLFLWILNKLMGLLPRKRCRAINKMVRIFDSSPIELRGKEYKSWTDLHRTIRTQGLKLHVEYDLALGAPTRVNVSYPNYNDLSMGRTWPIEKGTIYVMDKGYYDFNWWWSIHQTQAYFITRLKKNAAIIVNTNTATNPNKIVEDQLIYLKNKTPRGGKRNLYTSPLRRIEVERKGKPPLILVTNLMDLAAKKVAALYKARWEIELFFKWIKQNLKIKKFIGRSANAVTIQLVTALITYVLIYLFKRLIKKTFSMQHMLIWVRHHAAIKITSNKWIAPPPIYQFSTLPLLVNKQGAYI
jgi:IS4 transposase